MKKLWLLASCPGVLAGRAQAQAAPAASIAAARIGEGSNSTAVITRGEGKSEQVATGSGVSIKNLTRASEGYPDLFKQQYAEGHVLQATPSVVQGSSVGYLALLFVKKTKPAQ